MYKLSKELINILKKNNIKYCHWKSNLLLEKALNGYDDLDLLVADKDINKFESLIINLGFKEGSNKNISFTGIKHFYGLDESGEILHLHIYYQVKTGPSWTKSYRFGFEDYILNNLDFHESGMPVPKKYIELVIFVFRIVLKYSKINEFVLIHKEHSRTLKELEFLMQDVDENKLEKFLTDFFNLSLKEFYKYIDIIKKGSRLNKYLAGKKIIKKLKRYKYLNLFEENFNNIYQFIYRVLNKLLFKQKKKFSKGTFIVIAGLDATGKTTTTNDIKRWLGKNFTVRLVHFGKPPSTFLTFPFNVAIKFLRKNKSSELKSSIKKDDKPKSLLYIIRQVVLAYDRYKLTKKYWNKVSKGEIVIFDRYKSENYGVMDSRRLNPSHYTGIKRKLALYENYLYSIMPRPDVIFYLTVPVEIAVERNEKRIKEGKESAEFIRIRHEQNQNLIYVAKHLYTIDTNREYKKVIMDIKNKIWRIL